MGNSLKKNIIIIIIYPVLTQASESPRLTPTPPGCSIISPLPFCQLLRFGPVFDGGGALLSNEIRALAGTASGGAGAFEWQRGSSR